MITPKQIIDEFDNKFVVPNGGVMPKHRDYGKRLETDLKSFLITTIIEEYEGMLGEMPKDFLEVGFTEDSIQHKQRINRERQYIRSVIKSKIQQWKELLNNK